MLDVAKPDEISQLSAEFLALVLLFFFLFRDDERHEPVIRAQSHEPRCSVLRVP